MAIETSVISQARQNLIIGYISCIPLPTSYTIALMARDPTETGVNTFMYQGQQLLPRDIIGYVLVEKENCS